MRTISKFTQQGKHRERRWPDPLELLARIQAAEPGKLASWVRAQPEFKAERRPRLRAVFLNAVIKR